MGGKRSWNRVGYMPAGGWKGPEVADGGVGARTHARPTLCWLGVWDSGMYSYLLLCRARGGRLRGNRLNWARTLVWSLRTSIDFG